MERFFSKYRKEVGDSDLVKLTVITPDEKLDELTKFIKKENPNTKNTDIPADIIAT